MKNENDEAIDKRTCDDCSESSNLSLLKTFEMKKKLNFREIIEIDFRSMIENRDCCISNLFLFLLVLSLLLNELFVIDKKLK